MKYWYEYNRFLLHAYDTNTKLYFFTGLLLASWYTEEANLATFILEKKT